MGSQRWPKLPLKVRFLLGAHLLGSRWARRSDMTINRFLFSLVDPKASSSNNKQKRGVKSSDTTINSATNLWFRLFVPSTAATRLPVIFFFHGGGFSLMGANSKNYHQLCRRLAKYIPAIVISVNYRLSPEHKYPTQYEDGFEALKFVDNASVKSENINAFKLPPTADLSRCFVAGDSAGGNLAHHVVIKASEYSDFHNLKLVGLIAMQPFFGGEERTESEIKVYGADPMLKRQPGADWMWKAFLPEGEDRDHPAVNVFGPKSVDISGVKKFPATLLFIGGFDMLQDWQRRYYEGLKKAGKEVRLVEYPNAIHGFYAFPQLPESRLLMKEVKDFVERQ